MTLEFNTRHLPGSFAEWEQLVLACGTSDDTVETHWLERKGALDLTAARDKFAVAKAILAFANRDPQAAAPFLGGHALVLIGIEKSGAIRGVPRIEDHVLIAALKPYLGQDEDSPRWTSRRHRVNDTHDVLIIDIDSPRAGDPIFTLRKEFSSSDKGSAAFRPGFIASRPSTESVQADPAGIKMLSNRLLARSRQAGLGVDLSVNDDAITSYTYEAAAIDEILESAVDDYIKGIKAERLGRRPLTGQSSFLNTIMGSIEHDENRTEEQFRQQVEEWANEVRVAVPEFVSRFVARSQPAVELTLINTCGFFLEDVEVEVHIEGAVSYLAKPQPQEDLDEWLPRRPRPWGPWEQQVNLLPNVNINHLAGLDYSPGSFGPNSIDLHNSGSVTAILSCRELRPDRFYTFDEDDHPAFTLQTTNPAITSVRIAYSVTARGIHDTHEGELSLPIIAAGDQTAALRQSLASVIRPSGS